MSVPITEEAAEEFRALMQDPASREAFVALKLSGAHASRARYTHVLQAMLSTPWAIYPPYMEFMADLVMDRVAGVRLSRAELSGHFEAARRPVAEPSEGVAVIPVRGPIVPRASIFSEILGAASIEGIRAAFRSAMAAPEVSTIVFAIDSPGGSVQGVPELASEIRAARGRKRLVAVADGMMASAAYWLGVQADEVIASKSSLLGSIGVVTSHVDLTQAAEREGIKVSLISAGKYKTLGDHMEPLSEEGRAHIQGLVDEFYGMFLRDVARGRSVPVEQVRTGFGQGAIVSAKEAVALGMADRIDTVEAAIMDGLGASPTAEMPAAVVLPAGTTTAAVPSESISINTVVSTTTDGATTDSTTTGEGLSAGGSGEATDDGPWDSQEVESWCLAQDDPAAAFRAVSGIAKTVGEPDEAQHWALPHHRRPGRPANAAAIRNARARFDQTQDLVNREAARRHIFETHRLPTEVAESSAETGTEAEGPLSPDTRARMLRLARLKYQHMR